MLFVWCMAPPSWAALLPKKELPANWAWDDTCATEETVRVIPYASTLHMPLQWVQ